MNIIKMTSKFHTILSEKLNKLLNKLYYTIQQIAAP